MSAAIKQARTQRVADAVAAAWLRELGAAVAPAQVTVANG